MKMTHHYHDMENYIDYHDMTIILHITNACMMYLRMYVHIHNVRIHYTHINFPPYTYE